MMSGSRIHEVWKVSRPSPMKSARPPLTRRGAVEGVDLIVISIPFPAVAELPKDLFDTVPQDVPVIDTGNYYPGLRDPQIPEIDAGMPHSVWVSKQIGRPVIKAFNNILAHSLAELGRPEGSPGRLAIAVAGDDVRSKQIVMDIVNETGFDPVDAGPLDESWRQQPGTPAYCCDYDAETTRKGLAAAVKGEAPKKVERSHRSFPPTRSEHRRMPIWSP